MLPGSARHAVAGLLLIAAGAGLTACTPIVPLEAAPDAADAACAEIIVRLPDTVADEPRRETDAQATGAWGEPSAVILRCGVPVPGPTTLPCYEIDGVDWIVDDSEAPISRFTTYGRTPATEVVIDSDAVSRSTVIVDLGRAVAAIPAEGGCTNIAELDEPDQE